MAYNLHVFVNGRSKGTIVEYNKSGIRKTLTGLCKEHGTKLEVEVFQNRGPYVGTFRGSRSCKQR